MRKTHFCNIASDNGVIIEFTFKNKNRVENKIRQLLSYGGHLIMKSIYSVKPIDYSTLDEINTCMLDGFYLGE